MSWFPLYFFLSYSITLITISVVLLLQRNIDSTGWSAGENYVIIGGGKSEWRVVNIYLMCWFCIHDCLNNEIKSILRVYRTSDQSCFLIIMKNHNHWLDTYKKSRFYRSFHRIDRDVFESCLWSYLFWLFFSVRYSDKEHYELGLSLFKWVRGWSKR